MKHIRMYLPGTVHDEIQGKGLIMQVIHLLHNIPVIYRYILDIFSMNLHDLIQQNENNVRKIDTFGI